METEAWKIEYDLEYVLAGEVVHQTETLPCKQGYHNKLKDWHAELERKFGEEMPQDEKSPIYKVRDADEGTYIELFSLGMEGGRVFPLDPELRAKGGKVMCSEEHPITLVAPDGTQYIQTSVD